MARKKYVNRKQFKELVIEEIKRNEMRELSQSEERDPELIHNWDYYVDYLSDFYTTVKTPPKPKPVKKEVKPHGKTKRVRSK